jgi:hypothetical protein
MTAQLDIGGGNTAELDVTRPSAARMYDYFLGGAHNLAIDRELADKTIAIMPEIVGLARANRAFLQRAVRYCLAAGLRQFLDLGSGIPTVGHVHEIAHTVDPTARVAYVDIEPVAVAQTRRLLADVPTATVTKADIAEPSAVLAAPGVAELLDFDKPIAVIACAVLHFVSDERRPAALLAAYRAAVRPGSMLVFSHGASPLTGGSLTGSSLTGSSLTGSSLTGSSLTGSSLTGIDESDEISSLYGQTTLPGQRRTKADIENMLAGWDLVEPGLVDAAAWRPDDDQATPPEDSPLNIWAAVGNRS